MTEYQSPGVFTREQPSGSPGIRGASTSIGALLGRTLRGPVNKRIRCTSADKFQRIFGAYNENSYMAESVDGFFKNGGRTLDIVRIQGSDGGSNVKSSVSLYSDGPAGYGELLSDVGAFPVALLPGDTFIGKVGTGGSSGTATVAATPDVYTFTGGTYAAGAGGDSITVSRTVMGVTVVSTKDLSAVGATQADWIAALNSISGMNAVEDGADIIWSTDQMGSGATAVITAYGGAAAAKLGGGAAPVAFTNAGPNNVANVDQVTAAELAAMFEAVVNLSTGATASAPSTTQFRWRSDTAGASPLGVQLTAGTGTSKIAGFDTDFHAGTDSSSQEAFVAEAKGPGADSDAFTILVSSQNEKLINALGGEVFAGANASVDLTNAAVSRIKKGDTLFFEDVGNTTTARGVVASILNRTIVFESSLNVVGSSLSVAGTTVTNETFSLSVRRNGQVVQGPHKGLRISPLSTSYYVTVLNADEDEYLVTVTDSSPVLGDGLDLRPVNFTSDGDAMGGGAEASTFTDTDYIGSQSLATGFYALDKAQDIRMIATPGITGIDNPGAISKALDDYCNNRGTCVAYLDMPLGTSVSSALTYKSDVLGGTSYAIINYPWVQIVDPLTSQPLYAPNSAFVMGVTARTDTLRGVQKVAAGEVDGRLAGTIDLELELTQADRDQLYPLNINPLINIPNIGQCVYGSRTCETGEFNQINLRRVFIYVRESLRIGTQYLVFEPNDAETRAKAKRSCEGFLDREWRKNPPLLDGATGADAYFVKCDETNNPPTVVAAGVFKITVGIRVPRTSEFVEITVQQDQRGAEATFQ
jgi:uncharacterized protein